MKTCQYCSQPNLRWGYVAEFGWRLFAGAIMHVCPAGSAVAKRRQALPAPRPAPTPDTYRPSAYEVARDEYRATYGEPIKGQKPSATKLMLLLIPTQPMSGPEFEFD